MNFAELMLPAADAIEARPRLEGLLRLLEVTRRLAAEIDVPRILELVTEEVCQALRCDRASLYQFDIKRQELFTIFTTELEAAEIRHDLDHGICGYAARMSETVNVPDVTVDPRWNRRFDQTTGYQTRNMLVAPLHAPSDGALLGVLQLLNKADGTFDKFDERLLEAFSQHAAVALDRARLVDQLRQRATVESSLSVARDIQRGFMPRELPQAAGYELASWWFPNEAVGGDYCDVLPMGRDRLGLVIADVSGHGLGPSLIMASCRAALRALLLEHSSPELLLAMLGRALAADLKNGLFITMIMADLDLVAHRLVYANAGHAPAEHYAAATDTFTALEATGYPLGIEEEPEFPSVPAVTMNVGDLVVLCTDGIVEAMDPNDKPFGLDRLKRIVRQFHTQSARKLVDHLAAQVGAHFIGDSPPDDLTILVVKRVE
jgi:serine phosphatase RsbU (regulator of sigma subunit)